MHPVLRSLAADWKIIAMIALPIFIGTMWYGIANKFDDIVLFAIAMLLASWGVGNWSVFIVRKFQEWRMSSRRE